MYGYKESSHPNPRDCIALAQFRMTLEVARKNHQTRVQGCMLQSPSEMICMLYQAPTLEKQYLVCAPACRNTATNSCSTQTNRCMYNPALRRLGHTMAGQEIRCRAPLPASGQLLGWHKMHLALRCSYFVSGSSAHMRPSK
mmetsp:Transcript_45566/g.108365  ORF Transcript_45566/g.108365 Transcript_45566/m.108365 type:complete len:141 (+) Transcript_45566:109-531(+)